jgi:VWFA-related protein
MQFRLAILSLLLILGPGAIVSTRAQSPTGEKPTLKPFGSSLKDLKWDPEKQLPVESHPREPRQAGADDDVIRIDTDLVVSSVMVLDKQGKAVQGLTLDDFVITEDGQPQKVGHFSLGDDVNVERTIVLIIDYSYSQLPYIATSVTAAKTLVDKLGPRDRMAIVTDDVELLIDFTRDKSKLKTALESLLLKTLRTIDASGKSPNPYYKPGRSDQFSALLATLRELVHVEDIRPIIIFQTDGDELNFLQPPNLLRYDRPLAADASEKQKRDYEKRRLQLEKQLRSRIKQFSFSYLLAVAEKSRGTVYSVIPDLQFTGKSPAEQMENAKRAADNMSQSLGTVDYKPSRTTSSEMFGQFIAQRLDFQSAVAQVATLTGGWTAFLEKPDQAEDIYSRILADLNTRYVIGYYPAGKARDGKRHNVLIEVKNHPEYTISGRKTYYAPDSAP